MSPPSSSLLSVILIAAAVLCVSADLPGEKDSLPGWLGASYAMKRPQSLGRRGLKSGLDFSRVVQLSAEKPRAFLFKGFLSYDECDHLIAKASPELERSTVVASLEASSEVSEIRTSSGMFINKGADDVVKAIEKRIEEWTFLPVANQEALQVLRYTKGQKYVPHVDYFSDPNEKQQGGQRYATVLMYLSNTTLGGETVFSNVPDPTPKDDTWSDCAKGFLAVKPTKGDALLFFSMHPDGSPDEFSMHYACPVVEGVKWSAPMWIHVRNYQAEYGGDPSICQDTAALCQTWAEAGECDNNPKYMVGDGLHVGACRKACRVCTPDDSNAADASAVSTQ